MLNRKEILLIEQAGKTYRRMELLELLAEENVLQRYKQNYNERITNALHHVLDREIVKKLI
ncbi:MAG: hypothetical protein QXU32_12885 [Nitrososphaerales archaeon]